MPNVRIAHPAPDAARSDRQEAGQTVSRADSGYLTCSAKPIEVRRPPANCSGPPDIERHLAKLTDCRRLFAPCSV